MWKSQCSELAGIHTEDAVDVLASDLRPPAWEIRVNKAWQQLAVEVTVSSRAAAGTAAVVVVVVLLLQHFRGNASTNTLQE